jgi:hypothetical protein
MSASKDESSLAYKKTALGASGEYTIDDSLENMEMVNKDAEASYDMLGQTGGGITLPSIFHNKKFEKELPQLQLEYQD